MKFSVFYFNFFSVFTFFFCNFWYIFLCIRIFSYFACVFYNFSPSSNKSEPFMKLPTTETSLEQDENLDCGKPANFTYYDNLVGVLNRNRHPNVPEPQLSLIFPKTKKKNYDLEVELFEKKLKKAKREVSFVINSLELFMYKL